MMRSNLIQILNWISQKLAACTRHLQPQDEQELYYYAEMKRKNDSVEKWYEDGGEDYKRYDYDLGPASLVVDIGGYKGVWADTIYARFKSKIVVYEPVKKYHSYLEWKYKANPDIKVFQYGLGRAAAKINISVEDESSSVFKHADQVERIQICAIATEMREQDWGHVDLIKINIEGGEYDLLDSLLEHNLVDRFQNIQIQFHDFVPLAMERRAAIRLQLQQTHRETYNYDFIWENWELKKDL